MKVEEWLRLNSDWDDTVTFQGSAPDPKNPSCEYGLWFFNQDKQHNYSRHWALRLKYQKRTREVVAWHLQLWNTWRNKKDRKKKEDSVPSKFPIVGPVEHRAL